MERFDKWRATFSFFVSFFLCVLFFYCDFCVSFSFRHIHLYKFKDKASKDELDSLQLWMPRSDRPARADGVAWKCEREWRGARTQCSDNYSKEEGVESWAHSTRELHTEAIYNKWRRHRRQKQRPAAHHQRNRLDLCVCNNNGWKCHAKKPWISCSICSPRFFFILNRLPFRGECAARWGRLV
jgi:hypothetical protein